MTHSELRDIFVRDGVLRVRDVVDPSSIAAMQRAFGDRVAALEFVENAGALRPAPGTEMSWWNVGREPIFGPVADAFARALVRVFGADVWEQVEGELGGYAMPNLPSAGASWSACAAAWHVDEPTVPHVVPPWVLVGFTHIDRVEIGGGGTVVLAGSHRRLALLADELEETVTTDIALASLARQEPWFSRLLEHDARSTAGGCTSAGVEMRLVELAGEPGDLLLLDPRCLHTTAANVSPRARLTMRTTCLRAKPRSG
ncbi:MAG: hypothetical protein ACI9MC_003317 [Kiritimatiellia bacterium]|jgi:hypothetical protein